MKDYQVMGKKSIWIGSIIGTGILLASLFFFWMKAQDTQPAVAKQCQPTASSGEKSRYPQCVLIFSKTGAFRHASIPDAILALKHLLSAHGMQVDATEDASLFTFEHLKRYKAIIFLMTSGHIFTTAEQQAFEAYIRSGGGYVGIHSASDTEYAWSWYGQLVGTYFKSHPHITQARLIVEDRHNPSTSMLPADWVRTDEWYNFRTNPRQKVHVLLSVDEKSYQGGTMGGDHPISWYHDFDGGRSWYTAMGHTSASYKEPLFLAHLWGGIAYASHFSA